MNYIQKILDLENSEAPAIRFGYEIISYKEFIKYSKIIASTLSEKNIQRIGVNTEKEISTYYGILASQLAHLSYVPLGKDYPKERIDEIKHRAKIDYVFNIKDFDLTKKIEFEYTEPKEEEEAYLLFTSGSTGRPKGVPIHHLQLNSYVNNICNEIDFKSGMNFSHMFELTFDLSLHDMFVCWANEGCLCIPTAEDMYFPHFYIDKNKINYWFSVPTLASNMLQMGLAKENAFKDLKLSIFCGEALPTRVAEKWKLTAPNAPLYNIYGPTEATIAFTIHEFVGNEKSKIVNIGNPFKELEIDISDDGELILIGDQVTNGYLDDSEKTKKVFFKKDGKNAYRTGDLVRKNEDGLDFLGRMDFQVKLNGHRVELGEVEHFVTQYLNDHNIICITLPIGEVNAREIAIVSLKEIENFVALKEELNKHLPNYMIPTQTFVVDSFPTNSSGKTDRKAIVDLVFKQLK